MEKPEIQGILEVGVYVKDISQSIKFYQDLFDFSILKSDGRFAALDVKGKQVLLLFKYGGFSEPIKIPGGILPGHDSTGTSHLSFSIRAESINEWTKWLSEKNIEIESRITWEKGGQSLYFRDLDGNLLELSSPGIWDTF